jgi:hypothetical protein
MTSPRTAPSFGDEPGAALPSLYNLVYCSRATALADDPALDRVIATARRHNSVHGITGLLVYGNGIFFQWLEGPRQTVQPLMERIRADPRHEDVVELTHAEEVRERLFPTWDMELVGAADIRDVLRDALTQADDAQHAQALQGMLALLQSGPLSALGQD